MRILRTDRLVLVRSLFSWLRARRSGRAVFARRAPRVRNGRDGMLEDQLFLRARFE